MNQDAGNQRSPDGILPDAHEAEERPRRGRKPLHRSCSVAGCDRPHVAHGYCQQHYGRLRTHGDPLAKVREQVRGRQGCLVEGCDRPHSAKGYCALHYNHLRLYGNPLAVKVPPVDWSKRKAEAARHPCRVEGCPRPAKITGLCGTHYRRFKVHGDPSIVLKRESPKCSVDGCETTARSRGLCKSHYNRWKRYGDPLHPGRQPKGLCAVEGCGRQARTRGWCAAHYQQWLKHRVVKPLSSQAPGHCTIAGCTVRCFCRGYCRAHYYRWKRYGDPLGVPAPKISRTTAVVDGKNRAKTSTAKAAGTANTSAGSAAPKAQQNPVTPGPCMVAGCTGKHYARGYCLRHYHQWQRLRKNGISPSPQLACTIEGCTDPVAKQPHGKGLYCQFHALNLDRYGDLMGAAGRPRGWLCQVKDCQARARKQGFCQYHYNRWRKFGDPATAHARWNHPKGCQVEGCDGKHASKGYCARHYEKFRKYGTPYGLDANIEAARRAGTPERAVSLAYARALADALDSRRDCPPAPADCSCTLYGTLAWAQALTRSFETETGVDTSNQDDASGGINVCGHDPDADVLTMAEQPDSLPYPAGFSPTIKDTRIWAQALVDSFENPLPVPS